MRIAGLIILVVAACNSGLACTCAGVGPACSEAPSPNVAAVFLGTVESVGTPSIFGIFGGDRVMSATPFGGVIQVALSVQEAFKGVDSKKVVVRTNSSEAACGYPFKKGEQYLVYATEWEGQLYTSICQRTRPARFAAEDLNYLRKVQSLPRTSEIFGTYKRYTYDPNFVPKFTPSIMDHYRPPEEWYRAMAPMAGETATVTSESGAVSTTKVKTDGSFSFTGLAPGRYAIKVSVPAKLAPPIGWVAGKGLWTNSFEVLPKGCAEVTFRTEPDGHISGRIVGVGGRPLPNVQVAAWKAGKKFNLYLPEGSDHNKPDGTFDIGPLPPGKYILGAYVWTLPQGFPATPDDRDRLTGATLRFFPGTSEFDLAKPIVVDFGQHISNITITIPFNSDAWKDVGIAPGTGTTVKKH
jgi:hypothetical protein